MMGSTGNGGVVERLTRSTAEMSSHEKSEQADTMRRKLVELAAAHNRLVEAVDQHSKAFDNIAANTVRLVEESNDEANRLLDAQSARVSAANDRHQAFVSRSFMARLRWLVLGR
jgi:formiminotetrahydrofolate cyclodeaminase